LVDDIGNLTLLTYGSNQKLSDELPVNHLRRVSSEIFRAHHIPIYRYRISEYCIQIFRAHHIPENRELGNPEKMEEFIKIHKEKLKEAVEKFLSNV
jgi:hypothetical protein